MTLCKLLFILVYSREWGLKRLLKGFYKFRIHHLLLSYYFLVRAAYSKMPTTFTMALDTSSKIPWCIALMRWAPWSVFLLEDLLSIVAVVSLKKKTWKILNQYIYLISMCVHWGSNPWPLCCFHNNRVTWDSISGINNWFYLWMLDALDSADIWLFAYIHQVNHSPKTHCFICPL